MLQLNNPGLQFIKNLSLPDNIKEYINEYLIDLELYKQISKIRMQETFSIINKGIKIIPIYRFNNMQNQICENCYVYSLIKRESYYDNNDCHNCEFYIENGAVLIKYINIDFEEFINYKNNQTIDINARQIFILGKYLSENILIKYLGIVFTVNSAIGLLSEIVNGPKEWTIQLKKNKVLLKYYTVLV